MTSKKGDKPRVKEWTKATEPRELVDGKIVVRVFGRVEKVNIDGMTKKQLALLVPVLEQNIRDAWYTGGGLDLRLAKESLRFVMWRLKAE